MELTADSARGDNFFTRLPVEILEKEIFRWLSPPGIASLALAIGLQIPPSRRQPIYIRWKHIRAGTRKKITLTARSREPCDTSLITYLVGKIIYEDNPADALYLRMELGPSHGSSAVLDAVDYVMFQSMIRRGPCRGIITPHTLNSDSVFHAMLMMGEIPSDPSFLDQTVMYRRMLTGVDEKTLMEFLLQGSPRIVSDRDIDGYLTQHFQKTTSNRTLICAKLLEHRVQCTGLLQSGPTYVYKDAAASGYLWWLRDNISYDNLIPAKWKLTIADFTPRLNGQTLPYPGTFIRASVDVLARMIPGFVVLFGAEIVLKTARRNARKQGFISMARALYNTIGEEAILKLVTDAALKDRNLAIYVAAGGDYSKVKLRWLVNPAKYALHYGNNSFFRDLVASNEIFPSDQREIIAECIRRGSLFGLSVMIERGYEINPRKFRREILRCPNVDMVAALELL